MEYCKSVKKHYDISQICEVNYEVFRMARKDLRLQSVFCEKKEQTLFLKYYISYPEHKEIGASLGDAAVLLYIHYLRIASTNTPDFSDENTVNSLGWTPSKVTRYRLALTNAGWYKAINYTRADGHKGTDHHLGKHAVAQLLKPGKE
jgi:hypothetical protein